MISGKDILKDFSRVKKLINKGCTSEALVVLDRLESNLKKKITNYQQAVETKNASPVVPYEDFYLEVQKLETSRSKITVNPCTGRITLKISKGAEGTIVNDLKALAYKCAEQVWSPVTHRGKISYEAHNDSLVWVGYSGSKQFQKRVVFELNQDGRD